MAEPTVRERLAVPIVVAVILIGGVIFGLASSPAPSRFRPAAGVAPAAGARGGAGSAAGASAGGRTSSLLGLLAAATRFGSLISDPAALGVPRAALAVPAPALSQPPAAIPLNRGWRYRLDPDDVGLTEGWGQGEAPARGWHPVSIPNDFNPEVVPSSDRPRVGWYETTFTGPPESPGRRWAVSFESVRRHATVFLNGVEIGRNVNPYAPFGFLARTLVPGAQNTLIVRVDNVRRFPEDWWNWGGIVGPVSLRPLGRVAINDLGVSSRLGCGLTCGALQAVGTVNDTTARPLPGGRLRITITPPIGGSFTVASPFAAVRPGHGASFDVRVPIRTPRLWSPSDPQLYRVTVEAIVGGRVEQIQTLRTGMRTVAVHGGLLYLNGQRLWLHGAAIHEDADGHGAALTNADIATIVADLKAAGADITRVHYQLSPRLLDALDAAGIMVWAQPPVDHADAQLRTATGRAQALTLLRSTLVADRSHPSVVIDSVGNELSPDLQSAPGTVRYLQEAIPLARALSPGVPVALDTYCYTGYPAQPIYRELNVIGVDDYFGWYTGTPGHSIASIDQLAPFLEETHARYPAQAVVVSEWGAEAFYSGPATVKGTFGFQAGYLRQTYAILDRLPFLSGQIYWTLRDFAVAPNWLGGAVAPPGYVRTGIHHKGLLEYDGTPKPTYALAQRLFNSIPPYVAAAAADQARVRGAPVPFRPGPVFQTGLSG